MYNELIRELRDIAEWADGNAYVQVIRRAADAIEELCNLCYDLNKINSDAITKYLALWEKQQL